MSDQHNLKVLATLDERIPTSVDGVASAVWPDRPIEEGRRSASASLGTLVASDMAAFLDGDPTTYVRTGAGRVEMARLGAVGEDEPSAGIDAGNARPALVETVARILSPDDFVARRIDHFDETPPSQVYEQASRITPVLVRLCPDEDALADVLEEMLDGMPAHGVDGSDAAAGRGR